MHLGLHFLASFWVSILQISGGIFFLIVSPWKFITNQPTAPLLKSRSSLNKGMMTNWRKPCGVFPMARISKNSGRIFVVESFSRIRCSVESPKVNRFLKSLYKSGANSWVIPKPEMSGHFGVGFYMFITKKGRIPNQAERWKIVVVKFAQTNFHRSGVTDFFFGGGKGREGYSRSFSIAKWWQMSHKYLGIRGHICAYTQFYTLENLWKTMVGRPFSFEMVPFKSLFINLSNSTSLALPTAWTSAEKIHVK